MARKVCKSCKIFVTGDKCSICSGNTFVENWKGRVYINDPEKSEIAKRLNAKVKGEYAIKI